MIQLQSALDDEYNNFSGNIKPVPHLRANNWNTVSKNILGRSLRRSFIDPFSFARNAATLRKVLAPFTFSHVIGYFFLFFMFLFPRSFLIFMVTRHCVLNQLRTRMAYNFKFQRKRNEVQHPVYFSKLRIVQLSFTTLGCQVCCHLRLITCAWTGARGFPIWYLEK